MISLGIDIGAKNIKVVILKDNKIIAKTNVVAGFEVTKSAQEALNKAMNEAGISKDDIDKTISTGTGEKLAPFYNDTKKVEACAVMKPGKYWILRSMKNAQQAPVHSPKQCHVP